jgi:phosphate transport system protein
MTELTEGHTVRRFDSDLGALRLQVLEMAGLVLQQVQQAVESLVGNNDGLARMVIARDLQINDYDEAIATHAVDLLARRAPVAGDLRVVMAISRAVRDLERIGDEAKKIARMSRRIHEQSVQHAQRFPAVRHAAQIAVKLLRQALDSFARLDAVSAAEVLKEDPELDDEFRGVLRQLITHMIEDPRTISASLETIWVAKGIERIGDHAKNVAEQVIYIVKGTDVRHTSFADVEREIAKE